MKLFLCVIFLVLSNGCATSSESKSKPLNSQELCIEGHRIAVFANADVAMAIPIFNATTHLPEACEEKAAVKATDSKKKASEGK